jgi:serine phosphatase RsbU (regulator of sigma subunit)
MKKILIMLFVTLSLSKSVAQTYADKKIYLVDSLDFTSISISDKTVLDSCLIHFHSIKTDTVKLHIIVSFIEQCNDANLWCRYNDWVNKYSKRKLFELQNSKNVILKDAYKRFLASTYNNSGFYFQSISELDSAILYFEKSLKLQLEIKNNDGASSLYNNIGYIYKQLAKYDLAIDFFNKSLKIKEKINDKKGQAMSLINIGSIYFHQGNYPLALNYFFNSLKIQEEIDDKQGAANSINNIANIYEKQKEYSMAIEYYNKSLNLVKSTGFKIGEAYNYSNLGNVYELIGDTLLALENYNKSLTIRTEINDKKGMATCYNNIGYILFTQNKLVEAMDYYNKSFVIFKEINFTPGISNIYKNIGKLKLKLGKVKEAIDFGEKGLLIAKEIGFPEMIKNNAELLNKAYEKDGRFKEALEMRNLEISMRDSLENEKNTKYIIQQQTQYQYEKQKALDDVENDKKLAVEREAKEKQKIITYSTIAGSLMLALFLAFVYNRLQVTRKQKLIIEEQKEVVEKAHHELEEKNHEILQSINYAKRLQQSILPPPRLVKEYMKDSFVLYMPKDIVAGDFYWIESHNNKIYFAAADCTGHGVPGAMVSMVCHNALNRALLEFGLLKPAQILDKASELVDETFSKSEDNVQDGMDISLYCLDTQTRELQWAGANNPLWMITKENVIASEAKQSAQELKFIEIKADKQPVGRYENRKPFTNHAIQLNEGDSLFSITDGYPDQFGGEIGKKYTYKKLREFLLSINEKPMTLQKDELIAEFEKWRRENEQVDDICIIGVRV